MNKVEDFRRHAAECRFMANRARSLAPKNMLENMAQTWDSLAIDREVHIARQDRLAVLETGNPNGSIPIDQLNASNDE
jgi:hypothetical protein